MRQQVINRLCSSMAFQFDNMNSSSLGICGIYSGPLLRNN